MLTHDRSATAARSSRDRRIDTGAAMLGFGSALPDGVTTNADFAHLGVDDEWLVSRTGIHSRHRSDAQDGVVELGAQAATAALRDAGVAAQDVDMVVLASMSASAVIPPASALVAHKIGAVNAGAFDVGCACNGWISAMSFATGLVESGRAGMVLVVGAEQLSRLVHADPRHTHHLAGDGAGAALIGACDGETRIGPVVLHADASGPEVMRVTPDHTFSMDGQAVFAEAVPRLASVTVEAVAAAGLKLDDIDLFVMHQANGRITQAVARRLGASAERVVDCIETIGNTSSASIPIALQKAREAGRLRPGARLALAAFGGGLVWGGVVLQWGADA